MFGKRRQQDFSEEIEAHLELEIERLRERGLSREEAEAKARSKFGNVTRAEERFYEAQRRMWLDHLRQDLRFGLRMLRRNPGFTAVAVLTLALGIGANTAIFSLIHAVLLRPLPFPEPNRLVSIHERRPSSREADLPVSGHEFIAWKEQSHFFTAMALYHFELATITGGGEPETVGALRVSADFFPLLGVRPVLGRSILAGEDTTGQNYVTVLSDAFWCRRFGADKKIVGTSIMLDNQAYTVVGVMPPMPETLTPNLWLPIDLAAQAKTVGRHNLNVIARMKPGVTLKQAQSDLDVVARTLEQRLPQDNTDHKVKVLSMREDLTGDVRRSLMVLLGAVGFVLLIACLNVASLLFTRAMGRRQEMAVRWSLGASRTRLVRQLVTESLLLSAMGGVLGLVLAVWLARLVPHLRGVNIPLADTMTIDLPVLAVTSLLSLLSGIAAGIGPALRTPHGADSPMNEGRLVSAEPARRRMGSTLVATQVALSLVLLAGAGLLMKSFIRLVHVDAGFNPDHVLIANVSLPGPKYPHPAQSRRFFSDLLERLRALPGVKSAGGTTNLPLQGSDNWTSIAFEGRPDSPPGQGVFVPLRTVSPDYFHTLGIPLRSGRFFTDDDARVAVPLIRWYPEQPNPPKFEEPQPAPVAVISEAMARQFWPRESPLGRRFRVLFSPWITVVGVVGDVKHNALDAPTYPHVYLLYSQEPPGEMALAIRTTGKPLAQATAVREQVRALDPGLPVSITEMDAVLENSVGRQRFYVLLASAFGVLSLGLALVGIFGLASYTVSQRVREIGIRMALGARRSRILWMVLKQGLLPTIVGVLAGSAGTLALTRLIKSFLYQVSPEDPLPLIACVLLILIASLLALCVPARRAMSVDPNVALRYE
jgi:putative ABC transport system permease protein